MGISPLIDLPGEEPWSLGMEEGLPRIWRGFMLARIAVATLLLVLLGFLQVMGSAPHTEALVLCVAYLMLTCWVWIWGKPERVVSRFDPQWLYTVGADVLVFSILLYLQIGAVNFTPLFALPVLLAAVLGPLLLALGTAATVTMVLLSDAWRLSFFGATEATPRFLQAALTGTGLFIVAYLANQLAMRLAKQERLAASSAMAARAQTQVNQLVIDTLSDGVLVVDTNGIVRAANPAARTMLGPRTRLAGMHDSSFGMEPIVLPQTPFVLASHLAWQPLADMANTTLGLRQPQSAEVSIADAAGATRRLNVRTQLALDSDGEARDGQGSDTLCVVFIEDLREMEARLRTEKLAAMGRMSAAVAHEIRNPLAAITQANALLAEELALPTQLKLTEMVQHNARRLARIVDDVLDVSRVTPLASSQERVMEVERTVFAICNDWALQHDCGDQLRLPAASVMLTRSTVVFEEDHLRRVLVNLLDNAMRYSSKRSAAIEVFIQLPWQVAESEDYEAGNDADTAGSAPLRLAVWSDAPPIEQSVQNHLFEPFFSSESRSSGLGLYICRELCERHGAVIGYQRSKRAVQNGHDVGSGQAGNEFFVLLNIAANSI
ncbi:MAG: histidine kinase dimerization/phospho-acceptor domain-containing protein [Burkholderiaceae bacterium]